MRLVSIVVCLGVLAAPTLADLRCLGWDLLLNPIGLICHFEPELYSELTHSVGAAVNATVTAAENLAHFAVTHHPATVEYKYIQNVQAGGLTQANQGLINVTHDYTQVGIGFGKDVINTAVQIFNLLDWSDVAGCIIGDSVRAHQAQGSGPLPLVMGQAPSNMSNSALGIWEQCTEAKFSKPAAFKITEPNERIGRSISEIAQLLIPFEAPESAGADAFKLSVAGSKGGDADVYLWGKSSTTGEYFADTGKSQSIADAVGDPEYVKSECISCFPPSGAISAKRTLGSRGLYRRAGSMGICCHYPRIDTTGGLDPSKPLYKDLLGPGEGQLAKTAPEFVARDPGTAEGAEGFLQDLKDKSVGQIVCKEINKKLLKDLRTIFEGPQSSDAYKALQIQPTGGYYYSAPWYRYGASRHESIGFLMKALEKIRPQLKAFASKIPPYMNPEELDVTVDIFYFPPVDYDWDVTYFQKWHQDPAEVFVFGAADRPGLNIIHPGEKPFVLGVPSGETAFAVQPKEGTLYGWLGKRWTPADVDHQMQPTYHSVWGRTMADKGRLSLIFNVRKKADGFIW